MNSFKNLSRKTIFFSLVISILAVNGVGYAIAKENKKNDAALAPNNGVSAEAIQVVQPDLEVSVTGAVYDPQWERVVEEIQGKANEKRIKRLHKADIYNYTKQDIEQLILSGVLIEDIYYSDYIGNEWLVDPKELVQQKDQTNEKWEEIEKRIQHEKEERLDILLKKYPKIEMKLREVAMSSAEKLTILESVDQNGEVALDQAIALLQSPGVIGIEEGGQTDVDPTVTDVVYGPQYAESQHLQEVSP
ncbi:hypothetical protein AB4Z29_31110 [Paenibacillus sp. 2TAB23]|uniref:hypothetical protein n=1 Tax=Paenibacillus sp. 2TAB23 TaxID=3233004 RepID=UPI003F9762C7